MLEKMKAYIDSYEIITILLDKDIDPLNRRFYLIDNTKKMKIKLNIINYYEEYFSNKYIIQNIPNLKLNCDYYIVSDLGDECLLRSGSIIRCEEFEAEFKYDGPLGFEYSKEKTTFRIWSPVAKEIEIELIDGDNRSRYPLIYKDKGVWEITIHKDLDSVGYLYYVRIFEDFKCICDPYAISSSANGEYNYVIDIKKLYKMKHKKPSFSGRYTDSIIYEASVRDYTYYLSNENKGTFEGLIDNKGNTGLDYISDLGVTHLQLLPVFDFGGVDDVNKNYLYNWGYNPEQYFIPCGWYSKNPDDPYSRINELLRLVDEAHKRGLRINLDVVFNHVYKYEEFPFDYLVPGYFYRVDNGGTMSNASFCGNDIATERYMASRFVIDVLKYYAKIFNVSGFRFDLMGLLDIDTLNKAYLELIKIDKDIMLYGEGWNMPNPLPNHKRPHMLNHRKIPNYAFFNDRFRDCIRGSQYNKDNSISFGASEIGFDLFHLATGSCLDYYKFDNPNQTVNYVECHDNYTFYDYGITYLNKEEDKVIDAARLALEATIISLGIPFIHGGEEFFRTKQGVENSYNTKDSINMIDYNRRDKYISMVNTVKDLIKIRKEYDVFRMDNREIVKRSSHLLEGLMDFHTVVYMLEGTNYNIYVIIKNDYKERETKFNDLEMIFDGDKKCSIKGDVRILNRPGVYLFKGEKN